MLNAFSSVFYQLVTQGGKRRKRRVYDTVMRTLRGAFWLLRYRSVGNQRTSGRLALRMWVRLHANGGTSYGALRVIKNNQSCSLQKLCPWNTPCVEAVVILPLFSFFCFFFFCIQLPDMNENKHRAWSSVSYDDKWLARVGWINSKMVGHCWNIALHCEFKIIETYSTELQFKIKRWQWRREDGEGMWAVYTHEFIRIFFWKIPKTFFSFSFRHFENLISQ